VRRNRLDRQAEREGDKIGSCEPRSFFLTPETRSLAIQQPSDRMNAVSCPPTLATNDRHA
jgi:hypothetical protein